MARHQQQQQQEQWLREEMEENGLDPDNPDDRDKYQRDKEQERRDKEDDENDDDNRRNKYGGADDTDDEESEEEEEESGDDDEDPVGEGPDKGSGGGDTDNGDTNSGGDNTGDPDETHQPDTEEGSPGIGEGVSVGVGDNFGGSTEDPGNVDGGGSVDPPEEKPATPEVPDDTDEKDEKGNIINLDYDITFSEKSPEGVSFIEAIDKYLASSPKAKVAKSKEESIVCDVMTDKLPYKFLARLVSLMISGDRPYAAEPDKYWFVQTENYTVTSDTVAVMRTYYDVKSKRERLGLVPLRQPFSVMKTHTMSYFMVSGPGVPPDTKVY